MRLRNRPWKLLALLSLVTVGLIAFGIDLLSGAIELRRNGEASVAESPIKFLGVVLGYIFSWVFVVFGWVVFASEWDQDYLPPFKPQIDDPDKRRPL